MCEAQNSYIESYSDDPEYAGFCEDFWCKWQTLMCLSCSKISVIQYSSSSVSEMILGYAEDGSEIVDRPTKTEYLYPALGLAEKKDRTLELKISSEMVDQAIGDAEVLINSRGPISGVDRIHTVLHGYLRVICAQENITYGKEDKIGKLFKLLRQQHPRFQESGNRSQDIDRLLQSFSAIMDALNPIRNHASMAHPNEALLEKHEATLVIDVVRVLLRYIDNKLDFQ